MNLRKGCFRLLLICAVVTLLAMILQPVATRYRQWNPGNNPDNLLGIQSWFIKVFAAVGTVVWLLAITRPLGWVFLGVIILLFFSAFVYILRGFTDPLGTRIKKQQKEIRELKERIQKEAEGKTALNQSTTYKFDRTRLSR
jgi:ABC-type multidrug transport system fused ATPase/permease subunit